MGHIAHMATYGSSDTTSALRDAWDDNISYIEDGSTAKATQIITLAGLLIGRLPERAASQGASLEEGLAYYERERDRAQRFLNTQASVADGGSGIKHVDFRGFRA